MKISILSLVAATALVNAEALTERAAGKPYIPITAPKENIFKPLTGAEKKSVQKWLKANNVTGPGTHNNINGGTFELWPPTKSVATKYFDSQGPKPKRYARVSIEHYQGQNDYVQEYKVGPLPVSDQTEITKLKINPLGGKMNYGNNVRQPRLGEDPQEPTSNVPGPGEQNGWNGEELPHDDMVAPLAIAPDGGRYSFDPTNRYVEWMDFSFYTTHTYRGLGLHEIRYKGQRIIYELAMQEALAHYAGNQAGPGLTAYLDALYGFDATQIVPGYDCPSYATIVKGLCLFEFEKDYPIQRHTGSHVSVTKNIVLIARSLATIGNYDYQFTYEFYLDGTIKVIVRASGFIIGTHWASAKPDTPEYGYHIHQGLSGSMHDHVLNFKLDMDVDGTANSVMRTKFVPHSEDYPWSDGVWNTMKLERSFVENEDQGRINWDANAASVYSVVNKDKPNKFGEFPGYKIFPSVGSSIHNTVVNSSLVRNAVNWATHPLYAVKRKDLEPASAWRYNGYNIEEPMVDFNDFFNGESLDQTDIALYFNLGMHHVPDTYDLPNTVFSGAASGMTIRPVNYLLGDASRSTRQQVRINNGNVNTYGAALPSGSFDLDSTNPDLSGIN